MNDKGLDRLWSLVVRYRDNCTCVICGRVFHHERMPELHSHHIFPRSQGKGLRWDSDNGVSLCFTCHDKAGSKEWFYDRITPRIPTERFERLSVKIAEAKMKPAMRLDKARIERELKEELSQNKEWYADYCDSRQIQINHTWRPS